ncbi:hypothetical protein ACSSS7_000398 [Eimeria intestinalis]
MGEALRAPTRFMQPFEPSKLSAPSFLSNDAVAGFQELVSIRNRKLRSQGGFGFKSVVGAIVSAAVIAVVVSLCAAAYVRAASSQLKTRKLSEEGPSKSRADLAACAETSGGSGDDFQVSQEEEKLVPPPAKKRKVVGEGSDADAEERPRAQKSGGGQEVSSGAAVGAAGGAAAAAPKEARTPLELLRSPEEVMAAEALIALRDARALLSQHSVPGPAFEQQAQLPFVSPSQAQPATKPQQQAQLAPAIHQRTRLHSANQQHAELSRGLHQPAAALRPLVLASAPTRLAVATAPASPVASASVSAQVVGVRPQLALIQLAGPPPVAPSEEPSQDDMAKPLLEWRKKVLSSTQGLEMIDPLAEWEPPPPSEGRADVVVEHAFSRLPRVQGGDPSVHSSLIDPGRACKIKGSPTVQFSALRKLTALLAHDELSPNHLREVATIAQQLVCHLTVNETRQLPNCPSHAVGVLGFRFLLMDMTVAALHLLGVPRSGPWWDHMISRIPDKYNRPLKRRVDIVARFNFNLMTRLTTALRVLKGGQRPQPEVVVHLKRCLFCCTYSPMRFLRPAWDPWRKEDKSFYLQFEGSRRQDDQALSGPSHQSASSGEG